MKKKFDDKEIEKAIFNLLKKGTRISENGNNEEGIVLTPKSCFAISLTEANISESNLLFEDFENDTFSEAYKLLEKRFEDNGYIVYDYDPAKKIKPLYEPEEIFKQVVNVYYPSASKDAINYAWNVFALNMNVQGNTTDNE